MALGHLGIRRTRLGIFLVAKTGRASDIVHVIAIHAHLGLGDEAQQKVRAWETAQSLGSLRNHE